MSKQDPPPASAESYEPPAWLRDALSLSLQSNHSDQSEEEPISPALSEKYREAAGVALSLAKLRKEKERVGFVPLPLADYIQGLVKVANISLPRILKWVGLDDISRPSAGSARAFARLTQEIGINLREALIHIRIAYASQVDSPPILLLMARQRSAGGTGTGGTLEECEAVLGAVESEYELDSLRELRRTEFEIRAAYKEQGETAA
jgi:hypothetical protein